MKKIIVIGVGLLLLTGCGKKENEIVGTWSTQYELGVYGEITQTYEFDKNKTCKKILVTNMEIEKNCTYEVKEDIIKITYEDGQVYEAPYRKEKDGLVIGGYKHKKQD